LPRTATEKRIIEARKAKGVLVPILQETLEQEVRVEDEQDQWFMLELMKARAQPRENGVFSPSMLGSCMRQAYFAKTAMPKYPATSARSHYYFLDGDFRHYKWQFVLWKAHRLKLLTLLGVEVRVRHPSGDFAGTLDGLVLLNDGRVTIPDFKGMHVRAFQEFEMYGAPLNYKVQLVGYGDILNQSGLFDSFMTNSDAVLIDRKRIQIDDVVLIGENKGGPGQRSDNQIALREEVIPLRKGRSTVKRRLHALRGYVEREEVPPPACYSVRLKQFEECPFASHCREEVKAIQASREKTVKPRRKKLSVRRSSR
jgi:hypothetical protein